MKWKRPILLGVLLAAVLYFPITLLLRKPLRGSPSRPRITAPGLPLPPPVQRLAPIRGIDHLAQRNEDFPAANRSILPRPPLLVPSSARTPQPATIVREAPAVATDASPATPSVPASPAFNFTSKNFRIEKIAASFTASPQFKLQGVTDKPTEYRDWLEIEVAFSVSLPKSVEIIDEITFDYLVEFNGKLCPGQVTHTNILPGKSRYSIIYLPPRSLDRLTGNKGLSNSALGNVWVKIRHEEKLLAEKSLYPGVARATSQIPGLLLPKSETPFRDLWWDRYETEKTFPPTREISNPRQLGMANGR